MTTKHDPALVGRLRDRAAKIRGYIASSQLVVDYLKPEMDKFKALTGHDIYTVRMAVDHQSSIRTQTKEAEDLEAAVAALTAIDLPALIAKAKAEEREECAKVADEYARFHRKHDDGLSGFDGMALGAEELADAIRNGGQA